MGPYQPHRPGVTSSGLLLNEPGHGGWAGPRLIWSVSPHVRVRSAESNMSATQPWDTWVGPQQQDGSEVSPQVKDQVRSVGGQKHGCSCAGDWPYCTIAVEVKAWGETK